MKREERDEILYKFAPWNDVLVNEESRGIIDEQLPLCRA